jgi:hypothetical protein
MRKTSVEHERHALAIGRVAIYSILRDWIKGQVSAVETGMLSFEGAFLGQIMLPSGQTVLERMEEQKLLTIAPPPHWIKSDAWYLRWRSARGGVADRLLPDCAGEQRTLISGPIWLAAEWGALATDGVNGGHSSVVAPTVLSAAFCLFRISRIAPSAAYSVAAEPGRRRADPDTCVNHSSDALEVSAAKMAFLFGTPSQC